MLVEFPLHCPAAPTTSQAGHPFFIPRPRDRVVRERELEQHSTEPHGNRSFDQALPQRRRRRRRSPSTPSPDQSRANARAPSPKNGRPRSSRPTRRAGLSAGDARRRAECRRPVAEAVTSAGGLRARDVSVLAERHRHARAHRCRERVERRPHRRGGSGASAAVHGRANPTGRPRGARAVSRSTSAAASRRSQGADARPGVAEPRPAARAQGAADTELRAGLFAVDGDGRASASDSRGPAPVEEEVGQPSAAQQPAAAGGSSRGRRAYASRGTSMPAVSSARRAYGPSDVELLVDRRGAPSRAARDRRRPLLVSRHRVGRLVCTRIVTGIGSACPRLRAGAAAAARSHDDSRPPEKATRHRPDASAGSRMSATTASRSTSRPNSGSGLATFVAEHARGRDLERCVRPRRVADRERGAVTVERPSGCPAHSVTSRFASSSGVSSGRPSLSTQAWREEARIDVRLRARASRRCLAGSACARRTSERTRHRESNGTNASVRRPRARAARPSPDGGDPSSARACRAAPRRRQGGRVAREASGRGDTCARISPTSLAFAFARDRLDELVVRAFRGRSGERSRPPRMVDDPARDLGSPRRPGDADGEQRGHLRPVGRRSRAGSRSAPGCGRSVEAVREQSYRIRLDALDLEAARGPPLEEVEPLERGRPFTRARSRRDLCRPRGRAVRPSRRRPSPEHPADSRGSIESRGTPG